MKYKHLLLAIATVISVYNANAQCSSGIPNNSLWGTPDDFALGITIDNDINDTDTLVVTQGVDTSIIIQVMFPLKQNITSPITGVATVTSIEIQGVSGLPLGLNWRTDSLNAVNNTYSPQSNRFGALTVCGSTFSSPGLKTVDVAIEGCGQISGITDCAAQPLQLYVLVLPATGSGPVQMSPPISCDSANVQFSTTLSSPDTVLNPVAYSWLFHDGTTASGKNVSKHYTAPGDYPVQMTVEISEYFVTSASTAFTGGWYPDIEELSALSSPEPYLIIDGGNGGVNTGTSGSGTNMSWTGLNIPITSDSVKITAWDEDNGGLFGSADDDLGELSIYIPNPYVGAQFGASNSNHSSNITLDIQVSETLVYWDTVRISPPSTVNPISASNGFSICGGDSTTLNLGSISYDLIKWFKDSVEILGYNNATLTVSEAGTYYAEVVETGSICPSLTAPVVVNYETVTAPVIMTTASGGLYVDNPNGHTVQWYANGSGNAIPIPNASSDTLAVFNPLNAPFTVSFTSALGCEALSVPFSVCVSGTSSADNTTVSNSSNVTLSHDGFYLNPGFEVAWAISTETDGPITSMTELQTAIDNDWVIPSTTDSTVTVDCSSLPTDIENGNYYFTPITAEALVIDSIIWNPAVDSGCVPDAQLCLEITGTDWLILGSTLNFNFPDGSSANVISELIPDSILQGLPISLDTITPSLLGLLPSFLPNGLCFQLSSLYDGNPNGIWGVSAQNIGSGPIDVQILDIEATVYADSCSLISQDQVTFVPGVSGSVPGNSTGSISLTIPPLPSNFPTINSACSVFGDATMLTVDCGLAVNNVSSVESFSLYPNPNSGTFTLKLDLRNASEVSYTIFDLSGRNILHRDLGTQQGELTESVVLDNNLNVGFYVINMNVDGNAIQKHFIVK